MSFFKKVFGKPGACDLLNHIANQTDVQSIKSYCSGLVKIKKWQRTFNSSLTPASPFDHAPLPWEKSYAPIKLFSATLKSPETTYKITCHISARSTDHLFITASDDQCFTQAPENLQLVNSEAYEYPAPSSANPTPSPQLKNAITSVFSTLDPITTENIPPDDPTVLQTHADLTKQFQSILTPDEIAFATNHFGATGQIQEEDCSLYGLNNLVIYTLHGQELLILGDLPSATLLSKQINGNGNHLIYTHDGTLLHTLTGTPEENLQKLPSLNYQPN